MPFNWFRARPATASVAIIWKAHAARIGVALFNLTNRFNPRDGFFCKFGATSKNYDKVGFQAFRRFWQQTSKCCCQEFYRDFYYLRLMILNTKIKSQSIFMSLAWNLHQKCRRTRDVQNNTGSPNYGKFHNSLGTSVKAKFEIDFWFEAKLSKTT